MTEPKETRTLIRKAASVMLQIVIAFAFIIAMATVYKIIKDNSHGFDSSETAVTEYIKAVSKNSVYDVEMCFDKKSPEYNSMLLETYTEMSETKMTGISTDGIIINTVKTDETQKQNMISEIEASLSINGISDAMENSVPIQYSETIDGIMYDMETEYIFKTYCASGKWYIASISKTDSSLICRTENRNIDDMLVGLSLTGCIKVPENWTDISSGTDYDISYASSDGTSVISIGVFVDNDTSLSDAVQTVCNSIETNGESYLISDETDIAYKGKTITAESDNGISTTIWLFVVPLKDSYVHYVEITCPEIEKELYYENYASSFRMT